MMTFRVQPAVLLSTWVKVLSCRFEIEPTITNRILMYVYRVLSHRDVFRLNSYKELAIDCRPKSGGADLVPRNRTENNGEGYRVSFNSLNGIDPCKLHLHQ